MLQPMAKTMLLFLLAAVLVFQAGTVLAQNGGLTSDAAIDALIEQGLPAGTTLEDADDEQIELTISQAVRNHPNETDIIVRRAVQRVPHKAPLIAGTAAGIVPHMSAQIIGAVSLVAPGQTIAAQNRVGDAVRNQRRKAASRVADRALREAEQAGESPPARDDRPASPVQ